MIANTVRYKSLFGILSESNDLLKNSHRFFGSINLVNTPKIPVCSYFDIENIIDGVIGQLH